MSADNTPSSTSSKCGPHTQIVANPSVRITQCPCGTYHVTLSRRGLTVQMGRDETRALAEGLGIAMRIEEAEERGRALGPGSCVN